MADGPETEKFSALCSVSCHDSGLIKRLLPWCWVLAIFWGCTPDAQELPRITLEPGEGAGAEAAQAAVIVQEHREADTVAMKPNANSWQVEVNALTEGLRQPADSLTLRFELSGDDSELLRREPEPRRIALDDLLEARPDLTFGEPWQPGESYSLNVAVDMRAQKTLGLFRPEEGERVVVTGSWCDWCDKSAVLTPSDKEEGIWQGEVDVRGTPGSTLQWRFGIDADRALPGGGYETQTLRETKLPDAGGGAPEKLTDGPVWFDDRKRVVRFIAGAESGEYNPELHLYFDDAGGPERREPMMEVADGRWEMAFSVPEEHDRLTWRVKYAEASDSFREYGETRIKEAGTTIRITKN